MKHRVVLSSRASQEDVWDYLGRCVAFGAWTGMVSVVVGGVIGFLSGVLVQVGVPLGLAVLLVLLFTGFAAGAICEALEWW